ncbi:hypothetical protein [Serinicoccus chungangensis]|uniref:hypothetical protein n=1 Tax=Serinicoccus chungangensis TaxID=767452 RepID=UPI00111B23F3|nr:hypothetical protein [Serinicoccus chungangensis]
MEVDEAAVLRGAHPHGYLLLVGDAQGEAPADCRGWRQHPGLLPGSTLHLQPRTVVGHARGPLDDRDVVLLGHPVDVAAGLTDPTAIAGRLATTWSRSGTDAMVREAADLGGRWTLLAGARTSPAVGAGAAVDGPPAAPQPGVELLVVPDTHASQPVHVGRAARRAAVASAPALVADALGLDRDERALEILDLLRRRRAGRVTYLPGLRTAYLGVEALVPNSLLRLTLAGDGIAVDQRRFWPFRPRVATDDLDAVYAAFRERLTAHTALLAGLGRPAVSLTGGLDSRVTAAVAAPALRSGGGFAFTYLNPRDAVRGDAAVQDVTGARDVARQLGVPHRVLRWRQPSGGGTFDVLHRRTYAPLLPSRGAAHAMWADLPDDLVQLQSNGGESGTTFIRHRPEHVLSPRRLTELYLGSGEEVDDALADELYGDYLDRVPMDAGALQGFDDYDVLYWEQRMGRWGWQKFVDGDFGHRILLPFNDRVLLETMLSLPYPLRHDRVLFDRLLAEVGVRPPPARQDATSSRPAPATDAPEPARGTLRSGAGRLHRAVRRRLGGRPAARPHGGPGPGGRAGGATRPGGPSPPRSARLRRPAVRVRAAAPRRPARAPPADAWPQPVGPPPPAPRRRRRHLGLRARAGRAGGRPGRARRGHAGGAAAAPPARRRSRPRRRDRAGRRAVRLLGRAARRPRGRSGPHRPAAELGPAAGGAGHRPGERPGAARGARGRRGCSRGWRPAGAHDRPGPGRAVAAGPPARPRRARRRVGHRRGAPAR